MAGRWGTSFSFALLSILVAVVSAEHTFENTAVVRTVELGGALVHVTTTYAIKALEDGSSIYTIALSEDEQKKTSWIQAKLKGESVPLQLENFGLNRNRYVSCFRAASCRKPYDLPCAAARTYMRLNSRNLLRRTALPVSCWRRSRHMLRTHGRRRRLSRTRSLSSMKQTYLSLALIKPWCKGPRSGTHNCLYICREMHHSHRYRSQFPQVHSYTKPEGLDAFTSDAPVTKSGATLTYGPYNNLPSSTNKDFVKSHQKRIAVNYEYGNPIIEVTRLERTAEISHWGSNLNIQDNVWLHNAGPKYATLSPWARG